MAAVELVGFSTEELRDLGLAASLLNFILLLANRQLLVLVLVILLIFTRIRFCHYIYIYMHII